MFSCVICNKKIKKKDSVMKVAAVVCSQECKQQRKKLLPKQLSYTSFQYWVNQGLTYDEAKAKVSVIQRERSPRCVEYWIKKGCSEAEALLQVSTHQTVLSKKGVDKYTREERKKWSSFCREYWLARGYTDNEVTNILSQNADNQSLQSFITRHGADEGARAYKKLCDYRKKNYSLAGYINKHGTERGELLWNKKFKNRHNSRVATEFFLQVTDVVGPEYKIHTAGNENGEYGINYNSTYYYYDYVVPSLKLCIEFNGDYWHCNPKKYSAEYAMKQCGKTAAEIWKHDAEKIKCMEQERGFKVIVVWESDDYRAHINNISEIIREFNSSKN